MTTPHEKACREAFEKWAHDHDSGALLDRHENGQYECCYTEDLWTGFRGAYLSFLALLSDPAMVEEVARAIKAELFREQDTIVDNIESASREITDVDTKLAQAALAAVGRRVGV